MKKVFLSLALALVVGLSFSQNVQQIIPVTAAGGAWIVVPAGKTLKVTSLFFSIQNTNPNQKEQVVISDGPGTDNKLSVSISNETNTAVDRVENIPVSFTTPLLFTTSFYIKNTVTGKVTGSISVVGYFE